MSQDSIHHLFYTLCSGLAIKYQVFISVVVCSETSPAKPSHPRYDTSSLNQEISSSDIDQLKVNLPRALTDSLFKKLLDMEDVCVCNVRVCVQVDLDFFFFRFS